MVDARSDAPRAIVGERAHAMRGLTRYAAVGVVATLVHYGVLVAAVELAHWPAWRGSGVGALVGAQVAYAGNRWYTFGHRGPLLPSWLRFHGTALLGAAVNMAIVALGVRLGVYYLVAQVVATLVAMALTYAVNRAWSFR